ncbi:polyphosphate glucokinase [Gloeomargarita lithophora Alchichica-D10]|uniref:Polyphosphate glucokinase n=1 Tax=Gloeomargarita lithophora Alchichica-D10 TaxID=1188229 RepID=A0A1J0ACW4_9CYAN|nr:ROK family protein [Gloeomargarita lithophora]APB33761.1 polyphosphate glucokinase [Gloeomargarita lithophora Alchichica-D10]
MAQTTPDSPHTLAIDIGGSGIKALILNATGEPVSPRERQETPHPAQPEPMLAIMCALAQGKTYDRVSVGFPGVVCQGVTATAANLHPDWLGVNLQQHLQERLQAPVRVINDADMQGYGAIQGTGVELVITLGTGVGSALFTQGYLVPNLELAHHPFRKDATYEQYLGQAARQRDGSRKWNRRLQKALTQWQTLFYCDCLYLGGGNAKHIDFDLPPGVQTVSNVAGLLGGIALWRDEG